MRRVVVTGMGIQSCIGKDLETVKQSLYNTTSGIKANPEYTERGMRSRSLARWRSIPIVSIANSCVLWVTPLHSLI